MCAYKKVSGNISAYLISYVNDILITKKDIPNLKSLKTMLSKCFSMKDLGETIYILRIKIYRDRLHRLLRLSQNMNIGNVLKKFSIKKNPRIDFFQCLMAYIFLKRYVHGHKKREKMNRIPYDQYKIDHKFLTPMTIW